MAESDNKAPDPKKYLYPGAAQDDAIIQQVETQIKIAFPASYTAGLVEKAEDAPVSKEEMDEQKAKYDQKVNEQRMKDPFGFQKETQEEGPPPQPNNAPAKPNVTQRPAEKHPEAKPDGKKGAEHKIAAPPKAKHAAGGAEPAPMPPALIVAAGASMSTGQADLDKWLDGYPNKSPEAKEKVSKIHEMSGIAKSFDSQIDGYVKKGNGFGETMKSVGTWIGGKKELNAIFGENPYEKVQGGLGSLMRGLSVIQNVVSIIGNVAGKLGLFLTIAGLFAMIFPPLGTIIEAVARVINIIGIICDALGLVLSSILVALNGVELAQQIAKGGSNEEKAATADAMMNEANSAAGHIINLAQAYGPKFMEGFKGASKGAIGALFKRFKATVGTFASKVGGSVVNFAKKAAYKLGVGLEESGGPGRLAKMAGAVGHGMSTAAHKFAGTKVGGAIVKHAKSAGGAMATAGEKVAAGAKAVWHAPGTAMEKLRDSKWARAVSNSERMAKIEKLGGRMNHALDESSFVKGMEGGYAEKLGEKAAERLKANEAHYVDEANKAVAKKLKTKRDLAAQDAGNRTNARLDRDIKATEGRAADAAWDGDFRTAEKHAQDSMNLEHSRSGAVADAEQAGRHKVLEDYKAEKAAEKAKEADAAAKETAAKQKEADEKKEREEYLKDPKAHRDEVKKQEDAKDKGSDPDLQKLEQERKKLKDELEHDKLSKDERAAKKKELKKVEAERKEKKHEIAEKLDELRTKPLEGGFGLAGEVVESPKTLWGAKELAGNLVTIATTGDTEEKHKEDERDEAAEKLMGKSDREGAEHEEQHHLINEWHAEEVASLHIAAQADQMLEGLDQDLAEDEEHESDGDGDAGDDAGADAPADDADGGGDAPAAAPAMAGAGSGSEASAPADAASDAPASEPAPAAPAAKKPEPKGDGGGLPVLPYWPALVAPGGDFTTAHSQLEGLKVYGVAFEAAQRKAKKKALEAVDVWVGVKETTKQRSDEATKHAGKTQETVGAAGRSMDHAKQGSGKTDEGTAQQDKSKQNANGKKQEVPSAGAKPGWTHPIKRFWWYLKNWAAEKMAAVMGWIQEKIASLVLAGICGVTMGQLKQYTEALHRRMDYSKGVGVSAIKSTDDSKSKDEKNADFAHEQGTKAMQDAAECDKNIADAQTFLKDIDATQKQVEEEKARARTFMANMYAEFWAQKAKNPQQQVAPEQPAPSHDHARHMGLAAGIAVALVPGASLVARGAIAGQAMKKPAKPPGVAKPISPKAVARIRTAAAFVGTQAGAVLDKLTQAKEKQNDAFNAKLANRKGFDKVEVGESVVTDTQASIDSIKQGMQQYASQAPQSAADARAIAKQIRGNAESLEEIASESNQSLNRAFKAAYDAADAQAA